MSEPVQVQACAQHPDRVGGVVCQRCGSPMCPSCMNQASVGWHCPSCIAGHQRQVRPAQKAAQIALHGHRPLVTKALIGASVAVMLWDVTQGVNPLSGAGGAAGQDLALYAPWLEVEGEWYRVITAAFTHRGLMHIGFNMWLLWMLGKSLEARFGPLTFGAVYVAGIVGGGLGALLIEPTSAVVGASGAVFALMGAVLVLQRLGGMNIFESGIGGLVVLNVLMSFRGGISLGGHGGGLVAGLISGLILHECRRRGPRYEALAPVGIAFVALVLAVAIVPAVDRAMGYF